MSRNLSPRALQSMLAEETEEVYLMCETLSHSSFEDDYRLVMNNECIQRAAGEFQPFAFQLNLPAEQDDSAPQVQQTIDAVDTEILNAIRTLPAGERVNAKVEIVLASQPDTVEVGPIDFKILQADADASQVTATLGFDDDFLNASFPAVQYTPSNSPGIFA
ncbi:DUF1833 domain-containing protein [Terriglobus albidus]|uniref:DUF1833 domain-containing protein n=1 Tax=Terriglobus albidus TaxID=1592106 RepID=UPI0021DF9484|nr:DUF1833 domain-containing protein [Terriglobus albidus]